MKNTKYKNGFTLVETILAVTILGLVITSTAQLTQSSLRIGQTTTMQFTAYHLAEEGLEVVRALRDSNWLQNSYFKRGLADGSYVIREGVYPWALQKIADADGGATGDEAATEIILSTTEHFKRIIKIVSAAESSGDQSVMRVTSRVSYGQAGATKEVALEMELTDWKKGSL